MVWGRALSGQRSSGSRQAGGSRLSTAPAHLQTANGPPPRSEVPRPREPRGASSGFRFLTAAFHLMASFPTSDCCLPPLLPLVSAFPEPSALIPGDWGGSRFNIQVQRPLSLGKGAKCDGALVGGPLLPFQRGPLGSPLSDSPSTQLPIDAHTPPLGKASHPVQADSRRWAYPAHGAGGPQRKLNGVPEQLSLARLPSLHPSPSNPRVREPQDPALRVYGPRASCPRLRAKPKALPKASKWTPVSSWRRAQRPGQSTGPPSPGLSSRSQARAGNPGCCLHRNVGSRRAHIHSERGPGEPCAHGPVGTLPSQDHTTTSHCTPSKF